MAFRRNSYRVHVTYMETNPGTLNMYGLKKIPSKSGLHEKAKMMASKMDDIMALLLAQAGGDALDTQAGDSSGFSVVKYLDWEDAKRGIVSRLEFDKLHIIMAPHGRISVCEVTYGRRHDSPVFREMSARMPDGTGYVLLDAAYLSKKNCHIIADGGRDPVICPKSNSVPRGFGPMGKMLRWYRDDKDGFLKVYHQRSLVEDAFSVIKERFGAVATAKTGIMRRLQRGCCGIKPKDLFL